MEMTVSEMKIVVHEIAGRNAVASHHGDEVYRRVIEGIDHGEIVELDFEGVEIFSTPFFNLAIARLLDGRSTDFLSERVKFTHLSQVGYKTLRRVIDNAKRHYAEAGRMTH